MHLAHIRIVIAVHSFFHRTAVRSHKIPLLKRTHIAKPQGRINIIPGRCQGELLRHAGHAEYSLLSLRAVNHFGYSDLCPLQRDPFNTMISFKMATQSGARNRTKAPLHEHVKKKHYNTKFHPTRYGQRLNQKQASITSTTLVGMTRPELRGTYSHQSLYSTTAVSHTINGSP